MDRFSHFRKYQWRSDAFTISVNTYRSRNRDWDHFGDYRP